MFFTAWVKLSPKLNRAMKQAMKLMVEAKAPEATAGVHLRVHQRRRRRSIGRAASCFFCVTSDLWGVAQCYPHLALS